MRARRITALIGKPRKISTKIATIITCALLVVFTALSVTVIALSGNATSTATHAALTNLAHANGNQVQSILNSASKQASAMQSYIVKSYDQGHAVLGSPTGAKVKSAIYGVEMADLSIEVEHYLVNSMCSAIMSDEDIIGFGIFFEPGKYDPNIMEYSLYVNREDAADNRAKSMGKYSDYSREAYYQPVKNTQKPYFTKPYQSNSMTLITAAYPVIYKNSFQGVVVADIDIGNFNKLTATSAEFPSLYTNILTDDFTIVYDSRSSDDIGRNLADFFKNPNELKKVTDGVSTGSAFECEAVRDDGRKVSRFFYPIEVEETLWWSQTVLYTSDLVRDVSTLTVIILAVSALSLFAVTAIVILSLKRTLKPIQGVVSAAASIASGNLDIQLDAKSNDEIGVLSRTFTEMTANLKVIIQDIQFLLGEMSRGNFRLKTAIEEKYVGEYREILLAIRTINRSLSNTLTEINTSSEQVSVGAEQVSGGAQALSQGAAEQASSIEELTAAVNEISQRIQENADNAQLVSCLSREAGEGVYASDRHMKQLTVAMAEITATSNEIGKIIKTIDDIAFQTNILALNAAVEAARAGSVGKGFAVVADEVRNLAGKSAEAARNTTTLIESTRSSIKRGGDLAGKAAESLHIVVEKAETVTERVQQIAAASDDQSQAVAQLAAGIEQISTVVQTNSATAEESAAASEELSGQAQMLKSLVGKFRLRDTVEEIPPPPTEPSPQPVAIACAGGSKY